MVVWYKDKVLLGADVQGEEDGDGEKEEGLVCGVESAVGLEEPLLSGTAVNTV